MNKVNSDYLTEQPKTLEEALALLERYDEMVRSLCMWLSVGGYNNTYPKSPERAERDIRHGVDHLIGGLLI